MLYAGRLLYSVLCAAIDIVSLRNANMVRYANCKLSDKTANAMLLLFSVCLANALTLGYLFANA